MDHIKAKMNNSVIQEKQKSKVNVKSLTSERTENSDVDGE